MLILSSAISLGQQQHATQVQVTSSPPAADAISNQYTLNIQCANITHTLFITETTEEIIYTNSRDKKIRTNISQTDFAKIFFDPSIIKKHSFACNRGLIFMVVGARGIPPETLSPFRLHATLSLDGQFNYYKFSNYPIASFIEDLGNITATQTLGHSK